MRKNIWLINHYATNMFESGGGRHLYFSKYLRKKGYCPVIICSSFLHKGTENYIKDNKKYVIKELNSIPFVFIRTNGYEGNGIPRIRNMIAFYNGVMRQGREIAHELGNPDAIVGSSVHPLSCLAGIKLGRKFKCKVISEIRDLWPETLIMFGRIKENSFLSKMLYSGEKWIYKKSDEIIFTMEGGEQYIKDQKWEKTINLNKVHYINNGVCLEEFDKNTKEQAFKDCELDNDSFKFIYTGTIAKANGVDRLVEAMGMIQNNYGSKIQLLIFGDGEELEKLDSICKKEKIGNVFFKGRIPKAKIPYVLSKGNILVVNYAKEIFKNKHNALRYGGSHNKLFEYLAAGKPILYTQPGSYNLVEKYQCGLVLNGDGRAETLKDAILSMYSLKPNEYEKMGENARKAAQDFDFQKLTDKLIAVIER